MFISVSHVAELDLDFAAVAVGNNGDGVERLENLPNIQFKFKDMLP